MVAKHIFLQKRIVYKSFFMNDKLILDNEKRKKDLAWIWIFKRVATFLLALKAPVSHFFSSFPPNAQTILPYQRCELIELRIKNVEMFCTFLITFYCMEYRPIKQRKTFLIIQCINKVLIELELYP